ncbi:MAG TPA: beta-ketoacyl synthase chain length factor, partial [Gammaproteobacteria bacterium]|nr:beta-ketoacyl synthase chain length factor [Gammaproteobacteria bacterium]
DVSFLPALLRRRLDRHGRMALHTAWSCLEGIPSVQFVFASRHGDLDRTLELLTGLASQETLSPTVFSLSVHNSAAGLLSIARGDRGAATAMSAGPDTLGMGLLEGASLIAEGAERVLVCYADDAVPAAFQPYVAEHSAYQPFSISLLLTPPADAALQCRLVRETAAPAQAPEAALMHFLVEETAAEVIGVDQPWRLERGTDAA